MQTTPWSPHEQRLVYRWWSRFDQPRSKPSSRQSLDDLRQEIEEGTSEQLVDDKSVEEKGGTYTYDFQVKKGETLSVHYEILDPTLRKTVGWQGEVYTVPDVCTRRDVTFGAFRVRRRGVRIPGIEFRRIRETPDGAQFRVTVPYPRPKGYEQGKLSIRIGERLSTIVFDGRKQHIEGLEEAQEVPPAEEKEGDPFILEPVEVLPQPESMPPERNMNLEIPNAPRSTIKIPESDIHIPATAHKRAEKEQYPTIEPSTERLQRHARPKSFQPAPIHAPSDAEPFEEELQRQDWLNQMEWPKGILNEENEEKWKGYIADIVEAVKGSDCSALEENGTITIPNWQAESAEEEDLPESDVSKTLGNLWLWSGVASIQTLEEYSQKVNEAGFLDAKSHRYELVWRKRNGEVIPYLQRAESNPFIEEELVPQERDAFGLPVEDAQQQDEKTIRGTQKSLRPKSILDLAAQQEQGKEQAEEVESLDETERAFVESLEALHELIERKQSVLGMLTAKERKARKQQDLTDVRDGMPPVYTAMSSYLKTHGTSNIEDFLREYSPFWGGFVWIHGVGVVHDPKRRYYLGWELQKKPERSERPEPVFYERKTMNIRSESVRVVEGIKFGDIRYNYGWLERMLKVVSDTEKVQPKQRSKASQNIVDALAALPHLWSDYRNAFGVVTKEGAEAWQPYASIGTVVLYVFNKEKRKFEKATIENKKLWDNGLYEEIRDDWDYYDPEAKAPKPRYELFDQKKEQKRIQNYWQSLGLKLEDLTQVEPARFEVKDQHKAVETMTSRVKELCGKAIIEQFAMYFEETGNNEYVFEEKRVSRSWPTVFSQKRGDRRDMSSLPPKKCRILFHNGNWMFEVADNQFETEIPDHMREKFNFDVTKALDALEAVNYGQYNKMERLLQ